MIALFAVVVPTIFGNMIICDCVQLPIRDCPLFGTRSFVRAVIVKPLNTPKLSREGQCMVFLAMCLYLYSFIQFLKMIGQIFLHDASVMMFSDYGSAARGAQRSSAIKTFGKSVLAFFLAGILMFAGM